MALALSYAFRSVILPVVTGPAGMLCPHRTIKLLHSPDSLDDLQSLISAAAYQSTKTYEMTSFCYFSFWKLSPMVKTKCSTLEQFWLQIWKTTLIFCWTTCPLSMMCAIAFKCMPVCILFSTKDVTGHRLILSWLFSSFYSCQAFNNVTQYLLCCFLPFISNFFPPIPRV